MSLAYVGQIVLSGIVQGGLYALGALGLVVIYNATEVLNFAEGPLGAAAAFASWAMIGSLHLPLAVSLLAAVALSFGLGMLAQILIFERMSAAEPLMQTVATLGLFMLVEGVLGLTFGFSPLSAPSPDLFRPLVMGELVLRPQDQVILLTLALAVAALALFFRRSRAGLAMRGMVQNSYAVRLMGVPVRRIRALAWGAGCVLGGLTALLAAPITAITPDMMDSLVVYAFAAAIIGGFGSLPGAVVGGLVLGVANILIETFLAPQLSMTFVFVIVAVVLTVRPAGLFGRHRVQKV